MSIDITGEISENTVSGGSFGVSISMAAIPRKYTDLDDGFREANESEWFIAENGTSSLALNVAPGGDTGAGTESLTSPEIMSGSKDDPYMTIIVNVTASNGGNTLYNYYDIYHYVWSEEQSGGTKDDRDYADPFTAYGIEQGDFTGLLDAMSSDPPVGIKFRPIGGGIDGIYHLYTVENAAEPGDNVVVLTAIQDLSPDNTYTLERGEKISFSVSSGTIYEDNELGNADVTAYGSFDADFTWEMPETLQEDTESYRESYKNYIMIESDFSFDAYMRNSDEDGEWYLSPAAYNGSHHDSWTLESDIFYSGDIAEVSGTGDDTCWIGVSLSPGTAELSETGESPAVVYFEIVAVKRGDWTKAPAVGNSDDGEEYGDDDDDDFWNSPADFEEAIALGVAAALAAALVAGAAGAGGSGGRPPYPILPILKQTKMTQIRSSSIIPTGAPISIIGMKRHEAG